jgi:fatty acid desaturase
MASTTLRHHDIKVLLPKDKVLAWHQVSTLRGVFSIVLEWTGIVGMAWLCETFFSWPLYLFSVIFIGARYLALGLIMHESVHLLISKNRNLNDTLAEVFCAWPLFISMRSYRIKHLAHHRFLNTENDPDYVAKTDENWKFPMTPKKFAKIMLIQFTGWGVLETLRVMSDQQVKKDKDKKPWGYTLSRILYYLIITSGFVYFGHGMWLLWYWIIPFATWTQVANRLRRIAEHSSIEGYDHHLQTRTTRHHFLARCLLAPKNIALHNEHHLYPGVPCYHLPKLHDELMSVGTIRDSLYVSRSYKEVYRDCIKNQ